MPDSTPSQTNPSTWLCHPLTPERWTDFERLFGPRGAYGGCWCMWWRTTRAEFESQQGEGNRRAMEAIVKAGEVPGILLYGDGEPVGWCSVAPRENFASLNRSRVLKPIDDTPVWSIVCFYVAKGYRNQGVLHRLIDGAVDWVRENGGNVVEAYPSVPKSGRMPPVSSFMGAPEAFLRSGFVEVKRASTAKMIMRKELDKAG
ncbi:MAG: GNAT family N-acetyltransferase [Candidatus Neomarinimicrobiota bacterium]